VKKLRETPAEVMMERNKKFEGDRRVRHLIPKALNDSCCDEE
jgi:hypothetical protein